MTAVARRAAPVWPLGISRRRARWADEHLTPRERDVADLVARGLGNGEIARGLYLSEGAVKAHISRVLKKFDATNRTQATLAYLLVTGRLVEPATSRRCAPRWSGTPTATAVQISRAGRSRATAAAGRDFPARERGCGPLRGARRRDYHREQMMFWWLFGGLLRFRKDEDVDGGVREIPATRLCEGCGTPVFTVRDCGDGHTEVTVELAGPVYAIVRAGGSWHGQLVPSPAAAVHVCPGAVPDSPVSLADVAAGYR